MRIVSLLPSATEILFELGLGDQVAAVSHECDYPPETAARPRVTTGVLDPEVLSSGEIDDLVSQALTRGTPIYQIDMDILRTVCPDLMITQELCTVCAVEGSRVRQAAQLLDPPPEVISLEPNSIADVLASVAQLGERTGTSTRAQELIDTYQERLKEVRLATAGVEIPTVLCLEWLDPAWVAGHWMPEAVDVAGGRDVLAAPGAPSRRATWAEIATAAPEVVIVMPCGFDIPRTLREVDVLATIPEFWKLPAIDAGRVYAVNGSAFFSRAGPRLFDGIELLATLLHPERFEAEISPTDALRLASRDPGKQLHFEPM